MWWFVLFSSLALIGIGGLLLLKDFSRSRTATAKTSANPSPIATGSPAADSLQPGSDGADPFPAPSTTRTVTAPPQPPRLPAIEQHWPRLRNEIDAAVNAFNLSATALSLSIGPPGESTWSLHNRGFGDYRRILLGNDSIAWLRMELGADQTMSFIVRSHDAANGALNRNRLMARPHEAGRLASLLTDCLTPVIEMADARRQEPKRAELTRRIPATPIVEPSHKPAPHSPPPAPASTNSSLVGAKSYLAPPAPRRPATTAVPRTVPPAPAGRPAAPLIPEPLIDTAITLVNKAFVETGASLEPAREPIRREPIGPGDRALSITLAGAPVGLMLIETFPDRIDISVGVADLANFSSARRQSQPRAGLTIQSLAEAIATCAWPAIATAPAAVT